MPLRYGPRGIAERGSEADPVLTWQEARREPGTSEAAPGDCRRGAVETFAENSMWMLLHFACWRRRL